jgi:hypothetical protein
VGELQRRQQQVVDDTEALLIAGANDLPLAEELRRATGVGDRDDRRDVAPPACLPACGAEVRRGDDAGGSLERGRLAGLA